MSLSLADLHTFKACSDKKEQLDFLLNLAEAHPSQVEAQALIPQLMAHAPFDDSTEKGEWARHDWLLHVAQRQHVGWAHALLDAGVNVNLVSQNGERPWGAGQILREAWDIPHYDEELLARLTDITDISAMIPLLAHRLDVGIFVQRYANHAEHVLMHFLQHPDPALTDSLDQLRALAGDDRLPRYMNALKAVARHTAAHEQAPSQPRRVRRNRA